ncbi:MAG: hypothetical protein H7263_08345 [Candidatus Sericytochromatia bacterium]|nr:hypothetical protein [Candidatus Sericytochromatia bacterium]
MAGKKNKQVTSKGGNSFLTIQSDETESDVATKENKSIDKQKESNKPKVKKSVSKPSFKSEEDKIEEFADSVGKFLDKLDIIKSSLSSIFKKRFSETFSNLQEKVLRGKLQFLKPILPAMIVLQKINERWFNKKDEEIEKVEEQTDEQKNAEPRKPLTFLELAEKNIIFTDNAKKALYTLEMLKDKSGYVASESVIAPMVLENITLAFKEVAPKAKAIPTPETGKYAGIPMSDVMENINDQDILEFLEYVRNFPRGYVGKNYRITESFAGWAVSGTPDD